MVFVGLWEGLEEFVRPKKMVYKVVKMLNLRMCRFVCVYVCLWGGGLFLKVNLTSNLL